MSAPARRRSEQPRRSAGRPPSTPGDIAVEVDALTDVAGLVRRAVCQELFPRAPTRGLSHVARTRRMHAPHAYTVRMSLRLHASAWLFRCRTAIATMPFMHRALRRLLSVQ